jgi:hypothetical protein
LKNLIGVVIQLTSTTTGRLPQAGGLGIRLTLDK